MKHCWLRLELCRRECTKPLYVHVCVILYEGSKHVDKHTHVMYNHTG